MLQEILHGVLLIARVKISRYCNTINFSEDYFRQQYLIFGTIPHENAEIVREVHAGAGV